MHENDFFNEDLLCALAGVAGEDNVLMSEPMREHTTFKIGGPAAFWCTPRDAEQLRIISASLAAEGGAAQTLAVPDGSTVLRIPDGAASIKYTLTVQAR